MAVAKSNHLEIASKTREMLRIRILGTTPFIYNRMANKARHTLLVGGQRKTAAEKANLKHNPYEEFISSMEVIDEGPTALGIRACMIKASMAEASLVTEGIKKTQVQKLLFIPGEFFSMYGTPKLRMDVVRSADINRTPDIRTRGCLPKWGVEIELSYFSPLYAYSVFNLLVNAGMVTGVGDYRQQKGAGSFGSFRVLSSDEDNSEWNDLVENHGREAQLAAMENPDTTGPDTKDLLEFYDSEVIKRAGGLRIVP